MLNKLHKISILTISFAVIGFSALAVNRNNRDNLNLEAAFSGATTVYLDKTYIISQLDWWDTDETFLHYWTSASGDGEVKMTPVEHATKIYYKIQIPSTVVDNFSTDGGFRFFVYDRSSPQNQTDWIDGASWKSQNFNLFDIDTGNADKSQHMDWYVSTCS